MYTYKKPQKATKSSVGSKKNFTKNKIYTINHRIFFSKKKKNQEKTFYSISSSLFLFKLFLPFYTLSREMWMLFGWITFFCFILIRFCFRENKYQNILKSHKRKILCKTIIIWKKANFRMNAIFLFKNLFFYFFCQIFRYLFEAHRTISIP